MNLKPNDTPFFIKDCALAAISTGIKIQNIRELRDQLAIVHPGCIYYHFWNRLLKSTVESLEFHNDFSFWAHHNLHDDFLSERLEILNPTEYDNIESLRKHMLEILDNRLYELEIVPSTSYDKSLFFVRSKIVVFKTPHQVVTPSDLIQVLPALSRSSLFYHFIDARRRNVEKMDDFSVWLSGLSNDFSGLITKFRGLDPYFISLSDLREKLLSICTEYFTNSPQLGGKK